MCVASGVVILRLLRTRIPRTPSRVITSLRIFPSLGDYPSYYYEDRVGSALTLKLCLG